MREERWVDSAVAPEKYEVSSFGRIRTKNYKIINTRGGAWQHKGKILKVQKVNGYPKINVTDKNGRRSGVLIHRLVYCSFNLLDYFSKEFDVGHHNDVRDDCRLENLYKTNQLKNTNNHKLAYKLLDLYKKGAINIPKEYNINEEI